MHSVSVALRVKYSCVQQGASFLFELPFGRRAPVTAADTALML